MPVRSLPLRIAGAEVTTGDWIDVRSPWSGEPFARAARAGPPEIESAIAAAAAGFEETRRLPSHRRAEILRRLGDELSRVKAELVDTIVAEAGKPRRYAEAEVERGLTTVRLASEEATRIGGEVLPVDIEPRGEGVAVGAQHHEVTNVALQILLDVPLYRVVKRDACVLRFYAPCAHWSVLRHAAATGARIDVAVDADDRRIRNLAPAADTTVELSLCA